MRNYAICVAVVVAGLAGRLLFGVWINQAPAKASICNGEESERHETRAEGFGEEGERHEIRAGGTTSSNNALPEAVLDARTECDIMRWPFASISAWAMHVFHAGALLDIMDALSAGNEMANPKLIQFCCKGFTSFTTLLNQEKEIEARLITLEDDIPIYRRLLQALQSQIRPDRMESLALAIKKLELAATIVYSLAQTRLDREREIAEWPAPVADILHAFVSCWAGASKDIEAAEENICRSLQLMSLCATNKL